jgi:hypothetical protein
MPSRAQREPASLDRIAACRVPSSGTVNEPDQPEGKGALRRTHCARALAGPRRRKRSAFRVSPSAGSTTRWRDRQNRDRYRMVTPLTRERGGSRAPSDLDMLNPQSRASRLRAGSACCHRRPRGRFGSRRGVPSGSSARSNASHARLRKRSVGRRNSPEPVDLCLRGFQFTSIGQPAGRRDGYGCERSAQARGVPITA